MDNVLGIEMTSPCGSDCILPINPVVFFDLQSTTGACSVKTVKLCVVLAMMFLLGHAQVSSHDSDKARVLSLENAWNEAEKHKDGRAMDALLAASFAYTDSDGSFLNRAQFLASITAPAYHPDQIVNESMRADPYDHVVVITGAYREEGSEKGKRYARRGRFTDIWIQDHGAWLCAASQETQVR
jgi:hypothetical protein